jgi:hypothetical protein
MFRDKVKMQVHKNKVEGNIMSLKSKIYKFLRIWNDIDAIRKGKAGKRVARRVTGRATGKAMRKLFK